MIQRLKQWLRTVEGIQRCKRFQVDFSGTISKAMSDNLLRNTTNVRSWEILKSMSEPHSIPIKTQVMQQIGIDICNLPEVDGFKHLVVCIEYFSNGRRRQP